MNDPRIPQSSSIAMNKDSDCIGEPKGNFPAQGDNNH